MERSGIITDIQRFSLHDGPGIRTSVFLKGCNMRCAWCHNPECISFESEVIVDSDKCIGCGKCEQGCFTGARRTVGKRYTVDELMAEIMQDAPFYGCDGGVTLTGGEPSCQLDFAVSVLEACKSIGIGRAIETNLCYSSETLRKLANLCDIVMCDFKLYDGAEHKEWTGVSNDLVIKNLEVLQSTGVPFIVRTTVIPGVNDNEQEIGSISRFLSRFTNLLAYELLSYHPLGVSKMLEGKQRQDVFERPTEAEMAHLAAVAKTTGVSVRLNGVEYPKRGGND